MASVSIGSSARLASASRQRLSTPVFGSGLPSRWRACSPYSAPVRSSQPVLLLPGRTASHIVHAEEKPVKYNTEFGYSRKDVLIISVGLIAFGYALYYGLQATGMEAGYAGNWVQLIIFMGVCVGWVSTYVYRVATKQMTYVKQLEQYEEAVMRKRLEELTEEEMSELVREAEAEKERQQKRGSR